MGLEPAIRRSGGRTMCGRFTLFEADKILSKEFGVSGFSPLSPRYNIAPSQPVAAVRAAPAGA